MPITKTNPLDYPQYVRGLRPALPESLGQYVDDELEKLQNSFDNMAVAADDNTKEQVSDLKDETDTQFADVNQQIQEITGDDGALASLETTVKAYTDSQIATYDTTVQAKIGPEGSLTTAVTSITSQIGDIDTELGGLSSSFSTFVSAQTTTNGSVTTSLTSLTAQQGTNTASITSLSSTVSAQGSTIAAMGTTLSANSASISFQAAAISTLQSAYWTVTAVGVGGVASVSLTSSSGFTGFLITGNLRVDGNVVVTGSLQTSAHANNSITDGGSFHNPNVVAGDGSLSVSTGGYTFSGQQLIGQTVDITAPGRVSLSSTFKQNFYSGTAAWCCELRINGNIVKPMWSGSIQDAVPLTGYLDINSAGPVLIELFWNAAPSVDVRAIDLNWEVRYK